MKLSLPFSMLYSSIAIERPEARAFLIMLLLFGTFLASAIALLSTASVRVVISVLESIMLAVIARRSLCRAVEEVVSFYFVKPSMAALTAPHFVWLMNNTSFASRCSTPYSIEATAASSSMPPAVLTTKNSPKFAAAIISGETLESEHEITIAFGC